MQFKIFVAEGAKAPPDCGLEVKKQTHETILETDLGQKIKTGVNLPDSHLEEAFLAGLESKVALMAEDPNRGDVTPEQIVERERGYFAKIVSQSAPWRKRIMPKAVESVVDFTLGEVPIQGRADLVADEGVNDRVRDLKRQGKAPSRGAAQNSRQLATYAIPTGIADVGLDVIVENVTPRLDSDLGQITQGLVERVKAQYEGIAGEITDAIEKDRWVPVDTTDNRKAWVCTAQYCGAWRIGAKDWKTGRDIACPYGERAQTKVFGA